jgi:competence protein ComEC
MSHNEPVGPNAGQGGLRDEAKAWASGVDRHDRPRGWLDPVVTILEAERPRWFLWLPVGLGVGIGVYFWLANEPSWLSVGALVLATLVIRVFAPAGLAASFFVPILLIGVTGFGLAKARTEWTRAPVLERHLSRADVRGVVLLVEPRPAKGERITLRVLSIDDIPVERRPERVRIRTMQVTPGLKPGDHVRLRAKLGPPSPPSLPGDFDFARAAWFQGLGATGFALGKAEIEVVAPVAAEGRFSIARRIESLRQHIGRRVIEALPGETGAIATALITGERGGISEKSVTAFRDSGLLHILSISGLHMVVMAGAAFLGVRLLLSAIPRLALYYPVKKWAAASALLAALGYLTISGSSVATLRSAIMIAIMFLAILIDRPAIAMRNVAIAALILLTMVPETLLDAGFQMSFAAVICLVAVYEAVRDRIGLQGDEQFSVVRRVSAFFGGIVLSTLIAGIAVAPFAIYHFHQTQQYAVAANLVAIPICNIIVMPAALLTLIAMPFGLEAWPLAVMGSGIDAMMWAANAVASVPGAVGRVAAVPPVSLMLFSLGALWLALWGTRWRLLGFGLVAVSLALAPFQSRPDLIAGRAGALVVGRNAQGVFEATPGQFGGGFELERWLGHDGDARKPLDAVGGALWRCDPTGCVGEINGVSVAVVRHPAAVAEDCRRAAVVILPFPKPDGCVGPALIIDQPKFDRGGTHALYVVREEAATDPALVTINATMINGKMGPSDSVNPSDNPMMSGRVGEMAKPDVVAFATGGPPSRIRVETVALLRGTRPWTASLGPRRTQKHKRPKPLSAEATSIPQISNGRDGGMLEGDADE